MPRSQSEEFREKQVTYLFIAHDLSIVRFISTVSVLSTRKHRRGCGRRGAVQLHCPYTHSLISAIRFGSAARRIGAVPDPSFTIILWTNRSSWISDTTTLYMEIKRSKSTRHSVRAVAADHHQPGEEVKKENHGSSFQGRRRIPENSVHDTGSVWYKVLSFFFPIIGIIAAMVYKRNSTITTTKHASRARCTDLLYLP